MDFFIIKKLLGVLLMPMPFILLLLLLGMYFLLRNKQTKALVFLGSASCLLFVISFSPVPNALLYDLEREYPQFDVSNKVDVIVVLGCNHVNDRALPITSQMSRCSVVRATEAMRILQFNPNASIITSGNLGNEPFSNAYMNKEFLVAMGVPANKIFEVEKSRDTEDEAANLATRLTHKKFALVTAATHMKRSMYLFQHQNLNPIPAPTDHLVRESDVPGLGYYFPQARNIIHTERWWYEKMGNMWISLKSWFD
ncbi:ElyC/SanA/YdcF family protein [Aliiglaciecola sp. LCG003]|uniref:ElyC/SanA/YdcF family protein n=1 Tax=Aliiglaciecola sp. LCG003 TaxID=3053655 RepID=UPI0025735713|nr:ElyC/SanA/YdcF family protein [Aliiglaciecola sp. LCG003]WJG07869.1 ElyC/SanA/YdcF family protein [Aliiglaciecola sp. LCG003]